MAGRSRECDIEHDVIRAVLPHRYPIILVDRVLELRPGEQLAAVKAVTGNDPWLRGQEVDYPPLLVVESWCQAASVLAVWELPDTPDRAGQVPLFGAISAITFHGPVRPGDVMVHQVKLLRALSDTWMFEGETLVNDEPVLTVERVTIALRPASVLA
jgi:3-hydroxyacyl-[acyl-carrier-protein] dehydratase